MKTTYKTIIQNYFHRFQAEVSMAAFSNKKPGSRSRILLITIVCGMSMKVKDKSS